MKKYLLLLILSSVSAGTLIPNPFMDEMVFLSKSLGVRDTADTAATAALGGAALINLISLCSNSQKADLLRKALYGEITGKQRRIILARLGGSIAGLIAAGWVNTHRPFMRSKIRSGDLALTTKLIDTAAAKANALPETIEAHTIDHWMNARSTAQWAVEKFGPLENAASRHARSERAAARLIKELEPLRQGEF